MKYKIGDKVRVRKGLDECGSGQRYIFSYVMQVYTGRTAVIEEVLGDSYELDIDSGSYYWTDEMLEPAVKTLRDMQVGDILVDEEGDWCKVLGICGEVFFKSYPHNYDSVCVNPCTFAQAKIYGWKLEDREPEIELVEVAGKKYKKSDIESLEEVE